MNRQISLPVEILDMKIDVSLTCILCGTVALKKENEVARCNECQFKTEEFCKMKVNVLYSPVYYEVDLNTQAIRQFVTNVVKLAGKDQSEWMNINLERYWPTWRNKKVEMVLCLREETWSCIGIKGLEEDSKPVSYPQRQESRRRVSRKGEDNGFEYREVKVEEVEEPVYGPRQMSENMTVQGEEQAEGRKRRHEIGGGMRADEAVVRRNQRSRRGKAEHAVLSNIDDGDFENKVEHRTISEDFNDGRIREYDEMEYDNFEAEEGDGRQRMMENGDLSGGDGMDMDLDLGRNSEQESYEDDGDEEEYESDQQPKQKQTKKRSAPQTVRTVTTKTVSNNVQSVINATEPRREFSVHQKEVLNNEFKKDPCPSKKEYQRIAKKTQLTSKQASTD
ncbi:hypothetical protein CRE_30241 [Caenorhabditis remanei]|uniref:Homeobox domain-containing protein n=1 Tax=Caenorhabditis remanei TaxID=31234 RepID=E3NK27_CAERE|nr:hypothetical protein CRE_30241 [Caenorhabditis remanei]